MRQMSSYVKHAAHSVLAETRCCTSPGAKDSTIRAYRAAFAWFLPTLKDRSLGRVTVDDVELVMKRMRTAGLSDKTVRNYLGVMRALFIFAGDVEPHPDALVFGHPVTGDPLGWRLLYERLREALAAAGVDQSFGFHVLRHSYGTALAALRSRARPNDRCPGRTQAELSSTGLLASPIFRSSAATNGGGSGCGVEGTSSGSGASRSLGARGCQSLRFWTRSR